MTDVDADTSARQTFVQEIGNLLGTWGLPHATGRVFGYLLIRSEPASLDEISEALDLSKGAVSVATRQLDMWTLARRTTQPGSRRVLYEASASPEVLLSVRQTQTRTFRDALAGGVKITSGPAEERLTVLTDFFDFYLRRIAQALDEWHDRRPEPGKQL
ncbi:MAG: hypothetical protein QG608_3875 [Actinomycetota bacterium]|nr:hypothetical protein [Actinomycetota bacterium]